MRRIPRHAVLAALLSALPALPAAVPAPKGIKSVILMIPDGMSVDCTTLARWYNGGAPLALDALASGLSRTYNADTPIADSAPAATAMATGFKTNTPYLGVLPTKAGMWGVPEPAPGEAKRPVATVLEAAKRAGKSTGLVVTCELPHATPAGFAAHDPSRKAYDDILEQMVHQDLDVVFGGGSSFMTHRADQEDLASALKEARCQYITTPAELPSVQKGKVWGLFAPVAMAYDLDRDPSREPSLAEMTSHALRLVSANPKGFFLMVEGSKIDWAAHANDPVGVISDVLAFDKAVAVAVDYASRRKDTLVIAVSDHGNSGLSMGNGTTSGNYYDVPLAAFMDPLRKAKLTGEGLEARLNADRSNARQVLAEVFGITDLTEEEVKAIADAKKDTMNYAVGPMIARRAKIGFTTTGHTGEETVLYVHAPRAEDRLAGVIQNTDVARYIEKALGLDLAGTTSELFVEAAPAFAAKGADVSLDKSVPANPVLVVKKDGTELRILRNKNYVLRDRLAVPTEGVSVFIADTGTWYVSRKTLALLK